MRFDDTEKTLRELHARPVREASRRDDLELDLLDRHATITRPGRTFDMTTFFQRPQFALLLLAVLGVASCTVPTETEVEMGQRLSYTFAPESGSYDHAVDLLDVVSDMTAMAKLQPGVDDVGVSVSEADDGPMTIDLMIWGRDISVPSLNAKLNKLWPALGGAAMAANPLTSNVKTSLAENVGHHLFNINVVEGSDEEIRTEVLRKIYESVFEGDVDVTVHQSDGQLTYEIEMIGDGGQDEEIYDFAIEVTEDEE